VKKPPPLTEIVRFPASGGVALLAIFVTILDATGRSIEPLKMNAHAFEREPWRLVTSALPHGNAIHLLFNVAWLWTLGTLLEERFGAFRLLGLLLLFAAGSAAAEYALFIGGIGLSGAVYGLFGLAWVLSRADARLRGTVDPRTTQIFIGWFFFCILATKMGLLAIANVAHGVGALLGVLSGLAITGSLKPSRRSAGKQAAAGALVALVCIASAAGATLLRPRINLAEYGGWDSAALGRRAFDENNYEEAIARYRTAVATSPRVAAYWHGLGAALARKGDQEAAIEAFAKASALAPEDQAMRRILFESRRYLAYTHQVAGKHEDAARTYEQALEEGGDDALALFNLGIVYGHLGRPAEARKVLERAAKLDPAYARWLEEPPVQDAGD